MSASLEFATPAAKPQNNRKMALSDFLPSTSRVAVVFYGRLLRLPPVFRPSGPPGSPAISTSHATQTKRRQLVVGALSTMLLFPFFFVFLRSIRVEHYLFNSDLFFSTLFHYRKYRQPCHLGKQALPTSIIDILYSKIKQIEDRTGYSGGFLLMLLLFVVI